MGCSDPSDTVGCTYSVASGDPKRCDDGDLVDCGDIMGCGELRRCGDLGLRHVLTAQPRPSQLRRPRTHGIRRPCGGICVCSHISGCFSTQCTAATLRAAAAMVCGGLTCCGDHMGRGGLMKNGCPRPGAGAGQLAASAVMSVLSLSSRLRHTAGPALRPQGWPAVHSCDARPRLTRHHLTRQRTERAKEAPPSLWAAPPNPWASPPTDPLRGSVTPGRALPPPAGSATGRLRRQAAPPTSWAVLPTPWSGSAYPPLGGSKCSRQTRMRMPAAPTAPSAGRPAHWRNPAMRANAARRTRKLCPLHTRRLVPHLRGGATLPASSAVGPAAPNSNRRACGVARAPTARNGPCGVCPATSWPPAAASSARRPGPVRS